ncbi:hypothetical protein [Oryzifoliimicrobium ureilyticus]|uniref:hypothetical protein n=1 Tax=Oryzifoliimicrobium ureilyticus TaxID=3113724 RepID=UPI0030766FA5
MGNNENSPTFPVDRQKQARRPLGALHPLHEAAMRIAEIGLQRQKAGTAKTKDLIGLLLCHGARAWRYSQPQVDIHLHVTCSGKPAPVVLRIR